MKTFLISVLSFFTLVAFSQTNTNVGFAEAAGLKKDVICKTRGDALAQFTLRAKDTLLGQVDSYDFTVALRKAHKLYNGKDTITKGDVVAMLERLKKHPEDSTKLHLRIVRLHGPLVLETLTWNETGKYWEPGDLNYRNAHEEGEWALEFWGYDTSDSYCLNSFPPEEEEVEVGTFSDAPLSLDGPKADLSFPGFPQEEYREVRVAEQMVVFYEMFAVYLPGGYLTRTDYARDWNGNKIILRVPASQVPWIVKQYPAYAPCGCATEITYYQRN